MTAVGSNERKTSEDKRRVTQKREVMPGVEIKYAIRPKQRKAWLRGHVTSPPNPRWQEVDRMEHSSKEFGAGGYTGCLLGDLALLIYSQPQGASTTHRQPCFQFISPIAHQPLQYYQYSQFLTSESRGFRTLLFPKVANLHQIGQVLSVSPGRQAGRQQHLRPFFPPTPCQIPSPSFSKAPPGL